MSPDPEPTDSRAPSPNPGPIGSLTGHLRTTPRNARWPLAVLASLVLLLGILIGSGAASTDRSESDELRAEQSASDETIEDLTAENAELEGQLSDLEGQVTDLEDRLQGVEDLETALSQRESEVEALEQALDEREAELDEREADLDGREAQGDGGDEDGGQSDGGDDSVHYENCDAARAAGAAPVHEGDPGYGRHLDRDGDGVGCE